MLKVLNFRRLFFFYLGFFILLYFLRNKYFPEWYNACIQIFMLLVGYCILNFALKYNNSKKIFGGVLIFQLLCSFLMMYVNNEIYGDIYGHDAVDGTFYRNYGLIFLNKDFIEVLNLLKFDGLKIDDFGYPIIIFFATKIFGSNFLYCIVCLNAIVVALGSLLIYKLSSIYLPCRYSKVVALIWGIMPFAINTTAKGLKENFFVFFIILSFYFLFQYINKKKLYSLLLFFFFSVVVFLFRLVVGYALLFSFVIYLVYNLELVRRNYKLILVFSIFVIIFSFGFLAEFIINQRGYEYEVMAANAEEKLGGLIGHVTNIIAGLLGPIPNFVSSSPEKLTYITRYSFTPFFKMIISFYFWYAVYYIIKNKEIHFFPIIVFFAINTTMLLFTFFTLHDRFQWPHIPVFFLLSAYGYIKSQYKVKIKRLYSYYIFIVTIIIIIFNFR